MSIHVEPLYSFLPPKNSKLKKKEQGKKMLYFEK